MFRNIHHDFFMKSVKLKNGSVRLEAARFDASFASEAWNPCKNYLRLQLYKKIVFFLINGSKETTSRRAVNALDEPEMIITLLCLLSSDVWRAWTIACSSTVYTEL